MSPAQVASCPAAVRLAPRDARRPWIVAILAVVFYATVCSAVLPYSMRHDFLSFYTFAKTGYQRTFQGMYPLPSQIERHRATVPGVINIAPYVRPPFYAAILAPLASLPLPAAFAAWIAIQIALLLVMWRWAWRGFGPDSLVFACLFLPTAYGIAHGQDCVLIAAVVLASWIALDRGHDRAAGAIAALALIKFHLVLLLAPAMLIRKRWRMLCAFSVVALFECAASLALIGPAGVRDYVALLTDPGIAGIRSAPERMVNLRALLINLNIHTTWTETIAIAVVLAAAIYAVKRARKDWMWFWTALLASVLVNPHSYEYDAALLLPALLICIFRCHEPALRIAAATAAVPAPYLLTLLGTPWSIGPSLVLTVWFAVMIRGSVTQ